MEHLHQGCGDTLPWLPRLASDSMKAQRVMMMMEGERMSVTKLMLEKSTARLRNRSQLR